MTEQNTPFTYTAGQQKNAERIFTHSAEFMLSVEDLHQLPEMEMPEIAFAGRSNVGKSSLINALLNRKALARTSNTPGRTQQLNFFNISDKLFLVDMPGYGYAQVSKYKVKKWTETLKMYLRGRQNLQLVLLLIDSRHGMKKSDLEMLGLLNDAGVACQLVLTKTDKVKTDALDRLEKRLEKEIKNHASLYPFPIFTSATKKTGFDILRSRIIEQIFPGEI